MNRLSCELENDLASPEVKYFSPQQANSALVLIKRIVGDIVNGYRRLMDLQEILEAAQATTAGADCQTVRMELIRMVEKLQQCLDELSELGVELKDWALGIVDFPSLAQGREIYLCWQYDEATVGHWREVNDPLASRQCLSTLAMEQIPAGRH